MEKTFKTERARKRYETLLKKYGNEEGLKDYYQRTWNKAKSTMLEKLGEEEYKQHFIIIGKKGGENSKTGGFASTKRDKDGLTGRERARVAGRKGGLISKRGKKMKEAI